MVWIDCQGFAARRVTLQRAMQRAIMGASAAFLLTTLTRPTLASTVSVESNLSYQNYTFNEYYSDGDHAQNGTTQASTSSIFDPPQDPNSGVHISQSGYAAGGFGAIHLNTSEQYNIGYSQGEYIVWESKSSAVLTLDDVIITSPSNVTSVNTSINFLLEGSLQSSSTDYSGNGLVSLTSFTLAVAGNCNSAGTGTYISSESNGNPAVTSTGGILANFTGHGIVTTNSITLPTNTPFTLAVGGTLTSDLKIASSAGSLSSIGDFGNTLSFAKSGPVFNLPDGYTVNSASANISGNTYTAPADSTVPEPASFGLIAAAALPLMLRRKR